MLKANSTKRTIDPAAQLRAAQQAGGQVAFRQLWRALGPRSDTLAPVEEHTFHASRKWRFDFAWPAVKLAVEIDGGHFRPGGKGSHHGLGAVRDAEKANAAVEAGWAVLRYTTRDLAKRPAQCIEQAARVLTARWAALGQTAR